MSTQNPNDNSSDEELEIETPKGKQCHFCEARLVPGTEYDLHFDDDGKYDPVAGKGQLLPLCETCYSEIIQNEEAIKKQIERHELIKYLINMVITCAVVALIIFLIIR